MDTLDRETVMTLARHVGWPRVSIYMQTHPGHAESAQDQLRLKNLLKQATRLLESGGMRGPEIEAMLAPGHERLDESSFWRSGDRGIAAFFGEDVRLAFGTRTEMPERVDVSDRFVIRPLISAIDSAAHYYLLALSQNRVRVFEGVAEELTEFDAEGIPTSLADVLQYVDFETQRAVPHAHAGRRRREDAPGRGLSRPRRRSRHQQGQHREVLPRDRPGHGRAAPREGLAADHRRRRVPHARSTAK